MYSAKPTYFLGIDGGATKTDLALADREGTILRRLKLGSSNPVDIGMEKAMNTLEAGIRELCQDISFGEISLFAGISGGVSGDNRQRFYNFFAGFGFAKWDNGSDAQLIVAAGLGKNDGIAVILGTGSVAFVQKNGALHRIGGLGYLFDNGGNGYSIGRDVLRAVLTAEDGSGHPTRLTDLVAEKSGNTSALTNLTEFYKLGKRGIAAFAPLAFSAADNGDAVAQEIVYRNMGEVARLLQAGRERLGDPDCVKVVFVGGLTNREDALMPRIRAQLKDSACYTFSIYREPVVNGALLLAGAKIGGKDLC